jgi:hypothetical protein
MNKRDGMKKACGVALLAAWGLSLGLTSCAKPDTRALLLNRLKQASKLATVKFTYNKIVWGEKEKRLFIKLRNASFLAYSKVEITAGIDLAKVKPGNITLGRRSIQLTLPPVEIITYSYPFQKLEVDPNYTANHFLNAIRVEDMEEFLRLADADIRMSLNHLGIEERARENTRALLTKILTKFNFEFIDIAFEPQSKPLTMSVQ